MNQAVARTWVTRLHFGTWRQLFRSLVDRHSMRCSALRFAESRTVSWTPDAVAELDRPVCHFLDGYAYTA